MKNIFQNVKSDVVKSNQLKILKFLFEILARNDQEKKYSKCSFHLWFQICKQEQPIWKI